MPTANPTPSSTGKRVVTVGTGNDPSGNPFNYASLNAFLSYLGSQNPVSNNEMLICECYENQSLSGDVFAATGGQGNVDATHYVIIRPVPGLDVNSVENTGPLTIGAGVQLNLSTSGRLLLGPGVFFDNWHINISGAETTNEGAIVCYGGTNQRYNRGVRMSRFNITSTNKWMVEAGNTYSDGIVTDSLVVFQSGANGAFMSSYGASPFICDRNTFVRMSGSSGPVLVDVYEGSVKDNIFANLGAQAFSGHVSTNVLNNNFSDYQSESNATVCAVGSLLTNYTNDFRPKANGPLIGAATASAANTLDLRNLGRGNSPDVGAAMLSPMAAGQAPTGTITQTVQAGQGVTVSFSTANTPTSGTAKLQPASSNAGGAVLNTGSVSLSSGAGQATFSNVSPGNYTIAITLSNNTGTNSVTGTLTLTVVDNRPPVTPTQSTAGFRVVRVGSGLDYADLNAFKTYLATQNLVTNAEILCAEVYEDQTISGLGFYPAGFDATHYCLIRPVPGRSVNTLEKTAAVTYGLSGVELKSDSSNYATFGAGVVFSDMRIHLTGSSGGDRCALGIMNASNSSYPNVPQGFKFCRFLIETACGQAVEIGGNSANGQMYDSLMVFGASSPSNGLGTYGYPTINAERNTFVRLGVAGNAIGSPYAGTLINNAFQNMGKAAVASLASSITSTKNVSDNAADSSVAGFTVAATNTILNNATSNFKPAASGALIGLATNSAVSTPDLVSNNRGYQPDIGAVQLSSAVPLPKGTVTSQAAPDGQNLTIQFSTQYHPASGMASLNPDSSNPAGAVAITGTVTLDDTNQVGTATFTGIQPGNYIPTITLSNSGGPGSVSGLSNVSVNGFSGAAQAQAPDTTSPILTGTVVITNVTSTSATATCPVATDDSAVAGYEYSLTGAAPYTDLGNNRVANLTGLTPATNNTITFRAYDPTGNRSATLAQSFTTQASTGDTVAPLMSGSVSISSVTQTSYTASWQSGTDNVGIASYEFADDGVNFANIGNVLTITRSGLTAGTQYTPSVRAKDPSGNRSNIISGTVTTAPVTPPVSTTPSAPTNVSAIAGISSIIVSFSAPLSNGGAPISGYKVTLSNNTTINVTSSPAVLVLSAGTSASATVQASNSNGLGAASSASNTVTALTPGGTTVTTFTTEDAPRERTIYL